MEILPQNCTSLQSITSLNPTWSRRKSMFLEKNTHLFLVLPPGRVQRLDERGCVTHEHGEAGGAHNHAEDGEPHVSHADGGGTGRTRCTACGSWPWTGRRSTAGPKCRSAWEGGGGDGQFINIHMLRRTCMSPVRVKDQDCRWVQLYFSGVINYETPLRGSLGTKPFFQQVLNLLSLNSALK